MDTDNSSTTPNPEPAPQPKISTTQPSNSAAPYLKDATGKIIWATGRRKTAIAQVRMVSSKNGGKIMVNGKPIEQFFKGNARHGLMALESLKAVKSFGGYDLFIQVEGGGLTGQSEAIRHGIARALSQWNNKVKLQMRKEGFLTRDSRGVERKKSGQPKARKRFQYSKR
jgi:small subunit ribosomal protein S9